MTTPLTIEPIYVVDTHALIWYLTNDQKLGKQAAAVFAAAERRETLLYIPAIVITELYYSNKKWKLFPDAIQVYTSLKSKTYFKFVPLEADDVLEFDRDAAIPEMHDRIIAGLARRLNAPLLTVDPLIAKAGVARIVW